MHTSTSLMTQHSSTGRRRSHALVPLLGAAMLAGAIASCSESPAPPFTVGGTGTLTGLLFLDRAGNGIFDPSSGDSALPNVHVFVEVRGGTQTIPGADTHTDANGRFTFDSLPAGTQALVIDTTGLSGVASLCTNPIPVSIYPSESQFLTVTAKGGCVISVAQAKALPQGSHVTVVGTVTSSFAQISTGEAYVQDSTGGIQLFDPTGPSFSIGQVIQVSGTLATFDNELELSPDAVASVTAGTPLTPVVVTTAQVAGAGGNLQASILGQLVTIQSAQLIDVFTTGAGRNAQINDGSGAVTVRFDSHVVSDTTVLKTTFTAGQCYTWTGIVQRLHQPGDRVLPENPERRDGGSVHSLVNVVSRRVMARATLCLALAAGLSVMGASRARAQNGTTTGEIRGRAVTSTGAPVANATITAQDVNTGLTRSARSDTTGQFALLLLPPGVFTVRARLIGYRPDSVTNVTVTVGSTQMATLNMTQSAVELGPVTVGATRQTLDATSGSLSQSVSQQEIENLPAAGRDFTNFIALSGLVDPNPERTTGGEFSIAGARPSQTSVQIDGVDANNSFFGENRGGSRIPFEFSLESIREFQIITSGYDVEYGNYTGGIVNVVTRSGTNTREGTVFANYGGSSLTANDFAGNPAANFNVEQYAARISGPIVPNKAFYLFSIDGQREREPQVPLTPAYFLNKLSATGQPAPDSAGATDLASFESILATKYGIGNATNDYQNFQTTNDVVTLFGRLDFNLNDSQHLSVRENLADHHNDDLFDANEDFDWGLSKAENLGDLSSSLVTELHSFTSSTSFNDLRFQLSYEGRPREGNDLRPTLNVTNIGDGQAADYAGTYVSLDNNLIERKAQLIDDFTSQHGSHTLKVGGSVLFSHIDNSFVGPTGSVDNAAGFYTFPTLAALAAMDPSSYSRSETVNGQVPTSVFNVAQYAVYGTGRVARNTPAHGHRGTPLRHRIVPEPPGACDQRRSARSASRRAMRPRTTTMLPPRVSLAYDLHGNGSAVARAGAGFFYGTVPFVLGGNASESVHPVLALTLRGVGVAPRTPRQPCRRTGPGAPRARPIR